MLSKLKIGPQNGGRCRQVVVSSRLTVGMEEISRKFHEETDFSLLFQIKSGILLTEEDAKRVGKMMETQIQALVKEREERQKAQAAAATAAAAAAAQQQQQQQQLAQQQQQQQQQQQIASSQYTSTFVNSATMHCQSQQQQPQQQQQQPQIYATVETIQESLESTVNSKSLKQHFPTQTN